MSDSQTITRDILTQKEEPESNSFDGVVKTVIIHERLCISYAGTVLYADKVLKKILELKDFTFNKIKLMLFESHVESMEETHYSVGYIPKNEKIEQAIITNGQVVNGTNLLLWLGDNQAWKVFEKKFNELTALGDKKEEDCMKEAFNTVIKDKTIKSVDHFRIVVESDIDVPCFTYGRSIETKLNKSITIKFKKAGEWTSIPANVENKDIVGTSMFVSCHTSMFGFAIYDLEKESGVLFCPQLKLGLEDIKIVKGKTIETTYQNFIDEIYRKYQLPLTGFTWLSNNMRIKLIDNIPDHLKK